MDGFRFFQIRAREKNNKKILTPFPPIILRKMFNFQTKICLIRNWGTLKHPSGGEHHYQTNKLPIGLASGSKEHKMNLDWRINKSVTVFECVYTPASEKKHIR